jgi:phosphoglycerol transferase MdoB-like AlkP superfamily enzyme
MLQYFCINFYFIYLFDFSIWPVPLHALRATGYFLFFLIFNYFYFIFLFAWAIACPSSDGAISETTTSNLRFLRIRVEFGI